MSDTRNPTVGDALISLGITKWGLTGGEPSDEAEFLSMFKKEMSNNNGEVVYSTNPSDFGVTWDEVKSKQDTLQSEFTANEYARNRQAEYPSISELTVALYDTDDKSAVEAKRAAVKAKYPKP